ncbi:MAG: TetR/AcrR family transcriptional regulator [Candidatus Hodarchaeota archaeon]
MPSRKTLKLRDKKKERTRDEILKVAHGFFLENVYNDVSVEDIAEKAFVSRTTIYNYFNGKDEILFALGAQLFEKVNEYIENTVPSDLPGNEQVLKLCELTFKMHHNNMVVYDILIEFYKRIQKIHNVYEFLNEISESIQTKKYKELIEKSKEPYLIEFCAQNIKNEDLWKSFVQKGKEDRTIKKELETVYIVFYVFMMISGLVHEMKMRRTSLERIGMEDELFIKNSLELISIFLKSK